MKTAYAIAFGLAFSASAVSAEFAGRTGLKLDQDQNVIVTFQVVNADTDGTVFIYDYKKGESGPILGSAYVHAGSNSDLEINIGNMHFGSVYAVHIDELGERKDQRHIDGRN
jgi:uncharacterized membrane protein